MKIYELRIAGETEWIAANGIIEALKAYCDHTDMSLHDFEPTDELAELPESEWDAHRVVYEDEPDKTFREALAEVTSACVLASTAYLP